MSKQDVWPISDIVIGERCREDMGDIDELAQSIKEIGLLQPIVVRPDKLLVAGSRRLLAAQKLEWTSIPVYIVTNLDEAIPLFQAERDENTCRKPFNPLEGQHVFEKWMILLKPQAESAQKEGAKKGGQTAGKGRPKKNKDSLVGTSHKAKRSDPRRNKAARQTGYDPKTLRKVKEIEDAAKADKETYGHLPAKLKKGKVDGIYKEYQRLKSEKETAEAAAKVKEEIAAEREKAGSDPVLPNLRHCQMKELLSTLTDLDAIITDPPYPEEFLPLYGELARLAKESLAPHGVLAVMCGQSYLPRILADMTQHIDYRWTFAYLTPGGQSVQLWDRKINTFWKPILVFGACPNWSGDVVSSKVNDNDKRFHGWGQSESGMIALVEALTTPGQLVCDPFLGAGTTGVACTLLGRRFVGCDVDAACIQKATDRILLASRPLVGEASAAS